MDTNMPITLLFYQVLFIFGVLFFIFAYCLLSADQMTCIIGFGCYLIIMLVYLLFIYKLESLAGAVPIVKFLIVYSRIIVFCMFVILFIVVVILFFYAG